MKKLLLALLLTLALPAAAQEPLMTRQMFELDCRNVVADTASMSPNAAPIAAICSCSSQLVSFVKTNNRKSNYTIRKTDEPLVNEALEYCRVKFNEDNDSFLDLFGDGHVYK